MGIWISVIVFMILWRDSEPIGANLGLIKKVSSKNKLDLSGVTIRLITT